jgi:4'-phosphopantetheinyl transferase
LAAFYSAWTQKEAYLKGRARGLSQPPREIEVGLPPAQSSGLLRDVRDPRAAELWSLSAWEPAPGYTAALAVQGHDWRMIDTVENFHLFRRGSAFSAHGCGN